MADDSSFDCAAAIDLLCDEETKGFCFDDDDGDAVVEKGLTFNNGGSSDSTVALACLPSLSEECIRWMVEREKEHLPRDDYVSRLRSGQLDLSLRRQALDWMFKACAHYSFGEMCLYSAMSYLDRFLSVYELHGGEIWGIQLVAVACLSLAAKIEEVNVPSPVNLQAGRPRFLFEGKTIQKMEIVVLTHLRWKIKAYTPINFIDYYLRKMNNGAFPSVRSINKSLQIILSTIEGVEFLEFRPSEIAAAVAVYVSGETQEMDIVDKALSDFEGIQKERVVMCLELVQELASNMSTIFMTDSNGGLVSPDSPNGVLEAAFLSYKSDERTVESCPSSSHTTPQNNNKRRKIDGTNTATTSSGDS